MSDRIYKSRTEKVVDGVCGGLAEYFGVDPVLVRAAFVVVTLIWGAGLLVYIALMIIMPTRDSAGTPSETMQRTIDDLSQEAQQKAKDVADALRASSQRRRNAFAIVLIVAGALLLAGHVGAFTVFTFFIVAPVLLMGLGIAVLLGVFQPPVR